MLVETEAPEAAIAAIAATPAIEGDMGAGMGGSDRSSMQLKDGPQLDVLTVPPGSAGSYLVHFTGSAAHNVKLRHLAKERGWSLSEKGITELGLDPDAREQDATLRTFPTEAALYEARATCPSLSSGPICGVIAIATRTGATGESRSRPWSSRHGDLAMPTWCSATTHRASPSPMA